MVGSEWFGSAAGGLNRYFESLYLALGQAPGVEVDGWAFGSPVEGGHSLGPTGLGLPRRLRSRPALVPEPDVLDRHFALYGGALSGVRRRSRRAVRVFHFHGPWSDESGAAGERGLVVGVKRRVESATFRGIDRFVVLSGAFKALLSDRYDVDPGRISVIPPGVDLQRFGLVDPANDKPTVFSARRLERRMGIEVLLEAWRDVVRTHPDARLRIAGTGSQEAALRARAFELGIGSSVDFLGRVSDAELAAEYAACTVSAVPTTELEGFGLICLESLASGRAPVVTDVGGLPDSVMGLDPTLVVPAGDTEALAARLITALDGDRPTAAACRSHAETFSWASTARAHLSLYRSLLTDLETAR